MQENYTAIVLGKRDYAEKDRLYVLFTRRKGKIVVRATGARKQGAKLSPHLETGRIVSVSVAYRATADRFARSRGVITYAMTEGGRSDLFERSETLTALLRACAFLDKLSVEHVPEPEIFAGFEEFYRTLGEIVDADLSAADRRRRLRVLTEGFLFRILDLSGYRVRLANCAACGQKVEKLARYGFSLRHGGVLCNNCTPLTYGHRLDISVETLTVLRLFATNKLSALRKLRVSEEVCLQVERLSDRRVLWIV